MLAKKPYQRPLQKKRKKNTKKRQPGEPDRQGWVALKVHNFNCQGTEYHTAIMSLSVEELDKFNFEKGDTEGFVNYALSINDVVFTAFFIQYDEKVKISFRSLKDFRANLLSVKHFNGGGHINAAGGMYEGTLEEAIAKLKKVLPEFKEELIANC